MTGPLAAQGMRLAGTDLRVLRVMAPIRHSGVQVLAAVPSMSR
jgi:hypothetical protein